MRTRLAVATLTFAAAVTACSRQDPPTAARPTTTKATPGTSDLASVPLPYQRMRFVSAIEQSHSGVALHSANRAGHSPGSTPARHGALYAVHASLASRVTSAPLAMTASSAAMPASSVAVAPAQAAPPMTMPAEVATEFAADHGHGAGGFVTSVTIRGGVGPNGKCDPRSDAQAAGMLAGRPNSAMPITPSTSVFGRR